MEWLAILGDLPWILILLTFVLGFREPRPLLPAHTSGDPPVLSLPSVTIVVPARNEARNIAACLESLAAQEYPDFSILVVDDRSTDGTGVRARAIPPGNARGIRVLDGEPLPSGWFGKPWACHQGARASETDFILFTDADTLHTPSLLRRAVAGAGEDRAEALSLKGWQVLESIGERLVQPHIFALLGIRYRRLDRPMVRERSRDAIANGQYILVERRAYEQVGGHGAVRGEVVEDLRLAQILTGAGFRLTLREAEDGFSTRMYHSLREVVDGWTKNLAVGARQSLGPWAPLALPGILTFLLVFWIAPPVALVGVLAEAALGGSPSSALLTWAVGATALGLLFWILVYARFGVSRLYALLFPLGASIGVWIVVRSWLRGERKVEWKGRRYTRGEAAHAEAEE